MQRQLVLAGVTAVLDHNVTYPSCSQCNSKLLLDPVTHRWHCLKCGRQWEEEQLSWRYRLLMTIADSSSAGDVVVFGRTLQEYFGKSATDFHRSLAALEKSGYPAEQLLHSALMKTFCGQHFYFGFRTAQSCSQSCYCQGRKQTCLADILTGQSNVSQVYSQITLTQDKESCHTVAYQMLPSTGEPRTTVTDHIRKAVFVLRHGQEVNSCAHDQLNNIKQHSYREVGSNFRDSCTSDSYGSSQILCRTYSDLYGQQDSLLFSLEGSFSSTPLLTAKDSQVEKSYQYAEEFDGDGMVCSPVNYDLLYNSLETRSNLKRPNGSLQSCDENELALHTGTFGFQEGKHVDLGDSLPLGDGTSLEQIEKQDGGLSLCYNELLNDISPGRVNSIQGNHQNLSEKQTKKMSDTRVVCRKKQTNNAPEKRNEHVTEDTRNPIHILMPESEDFNSFFSSQFEENFSLDDEDARLLQTERVLTPPFTNSSLSSNVICKGEGQSRQEVPLDSRTELQHDLNCSNMSVNSKRNAQLEDTKFKLMNRDKNSTIASKEIRTQRMFSVLNNESSVHSFVNTKEEREHCATAMPESESLGAYLEATYEQLNISDIVHQCDDLQDYVANTNRSDKQNRECLWTETLSQGLSKKMHGSSVLEERRNTASGNGSDDGALLMNTTNKQTETVVDSDDEELERFLADDDDDDDDDRVTGDENRQEHFAGKNKMKGVLHVDRSQKDHRTTGGKLYLNGCDGNLDHFDKTVEHTFDDSFDEIFDKIYECVPENQQGSTMNKRKENSPDLHPGVQVSNSDKANSCDGNNLDMEKSRDLEIFLADISDRNDTGHSVAYDCRVKLFQSPLESSGYMYNSSQIVNTSSVPVQRKETASFKGSILHMKNAATLKNEKTDTAENRLAVEQEAGQLIQNFEEISWSTDSYCDAAECASSGMSFSSGVEKQDTDDDTGQAFCLENSGDLVLIKTSSSQTDSPVVDSSRDLFEFSSLVSESQVEESKVMQDSLTSVERSLGQRSRLQAENGNIIVDSVVLESQEGDGLEKTKETKFDLQCQPSSSLIKKVRFDSRLRQVSSIQLIDIKMKLNESPRLKDVTEIQKPCLKQRTDSKSEQELEPEQTDGLHGNSDPEVDACSQDLFEPSPNIASSCFLPKHVRLHKSGKENYDTGMSPDLFFSSTPEHFAEIYKRNNNRSSDGKTPSHQVDWSGTTGKMDLLETGKRSNEGLRGKVLKAVSNDILAIDAPMGHLKRQTRTVLPIFRSKLKHNHLVGFNCKKEQSSQEENAVIIRSDISPIPMMTLDSPDLFSPFMNNKNDVCDNIGEQGIKMALKEQRMKPSELRYTQHNMKSTFSDGKTIYGTLSQLEEGKISVDEIPFISIVKKGKLWYCENNRRLWVFKQLEKQGKCDTVPVLVKEHKRRLPWTTTNEGTAIKVDKEWTDSEAESLRKQKRTNQWKRENKKWEVESE